MYLHNNDEGISVCGSCFFASDNDLANGVIDKLNNGSLWYLKPTLPPPFFPNGQPNPNGDPNFYGTGGVNNPQTATHGITSATQITPTNQ